MLNSFYGEFHHTQYHGGRVLCGPTSFQESSTYRECVIDTFGVNSSYLIPLWTCFMWTVSLKNIGRLGSRYLIPL